jgi:hypothetical protein
MSIIMSAASVILWLAAILCSGAVGMLLEEGQEGPAESGIGVVMCFAVCALILQVMA